MRHKKGEEGGRRHRYLAFQRIRDGFRANADWGGPEKSVYRLDSAVNRIINTIVLYYGRNVIFLSTVLAL